MNPTQILTLILVPIAVATAHGYFTNWMAVQLLLKPVRPVNILGFKLQGLLPRRQADLADRLSEAIAREFLREEDILRMLSGIDPREALRRVFIEKWEAHIDEILSGHPFIKMFLSTDKLNGIRDKIADILSRESADLIPVLLREVEGKIDLREVLRRNILSFDVARLNEIIEEIGYKEFKEIAWVGALIGLCIGSIHALVNLAFFLR
jgi:uncharacterized membrane protein YheB (UPF0754 family)